MKKRYLSVLLTAVLLFATVLSATSSADNNSGIVLYKNDTQYSIPDYPPTVSNGMIYVPMSMFIGLKDVSYEYSKEQSSFYFLNKNTREYFAVSIIDSSMIANGSLSDFKSEIINSTVYLPLEYCAGVLTLGIDKTVENGVTKIRLFDSAKTLDFIDLLEIYDPSGRVKPQPEKKDDKTQITADTNKVPQEVIKPKKKVYITFDKGPNDYTENILKVLDKYNIKATFFIDGKSALTNPESVISIYTNSHAIGICSSDEKSADMSDENTIIPSIQNENKSLFRVLGFYSRLYRFSNDTAIDKEMLNSLSKRGYIIWGTNIESEDTENGDKYLYASRINKKIKTTATPVIHFTNSENTAGILEALLDLIGDDSTIDIVPIDIADTEIN